MIVGDEPTCFAGAVLTTPFQYGQFSYFQSQILKLSVSNPKSKYVAYLSVLSQISNCQGLGRKNKHKILKTDRSSHGDFSVAKIIQLLELATPFHRPLLSLALDLHRQIVESSSLLQLVLEVLVLQVVSGQGKVHRCTARPQV